MYVLLWYVVWRYMFKTTILKSLLKLNYIFLTHTVAYMIITRKQSFHSILRCFNFLIFSGGKLEKAIYLICFFYCMDLCLGVL